VDDRRPVRGELCVLHRPDLINLLVEPIKADLRLTDTQIGLLQGVAFALFYTAMGLPIGWLAGFSGATYYRERSEIRGAQPCIA
jgi:hypothetical protein